MFELTITELSPLGEFDETYGQRYWGSAANEENPISFNSMDKALASKVTSAPLKVVCESKAMKKSQKGTLYWQLKKVKPLDVNTAPVSHDTQKAVEHTASTPTGGSNDLTERLERIESKLDKLLGLEEPTPTKKIDKVAEVTDDEVDLSDVPF